MTIEELNGLPREAFVKELGWVFEHSPWVAERAWARRPFASIDALHAAMAAEVERASRDEQLRLLRAHPDLGTRMRMSAASAGEQSGAGLDRLTAVEFERLRDLNAAYSTRFGFPFILAVKGATNADIFASLERRLANEPEEEFRQALRQVHRIAAFRLAAP
jgi:2-oxo-4-hydroxy-4-carboxy-5-ureidoimidazoline decarboxylase